MVSIDEITADIDKILGETDPPSAPEDDKDTGIPKSVCSDGRTERAYVACYATSGMLSGNPNVTPDNQRFEMFHWITLRCHNITAAMSAVIGFELSEIRSAPNDATAIDVDIDEEIAGGRVSIERNTCSTCFGDHEVTITIQRSENDARHIYLFESTEMLRQLFASMVMDDDNEADGTARTRRRLAEIVNDES